MLIEPYYSTSNGKIRISREQGSKFAKQLAGDFNPLHDVDARRFCVPGDLLFAVLLAHYGLSQKLAVSFTAMVDESVELVLPAPAEELVIKGASGKDYLTLRRSGQNSRDEAAIDTLTRAYIEFSGHTFPDIMVPLLAEQNVMVSPTRPMVLYESMFLDLEQLDIETLQLETNRNELKIDGKRGDVEFTFDLQDRGELVGRGWKRMVLGGLKEFDEQVMADFLNEFSQRKAALTQR